MKVDKLILLLLAIALSYAKSALGQVPDYVPIVGLVSWYPFNGDAEDESANDNNGTVLGASLTEDRFGISNSAFSCDGVNDLISLSGNESITNDFTISFWFNPQSSDPGYLIDRDFCGTDNDWSIYYSENKLNIRYGMAGADYFIIPEDINEEGSWYHIVIVRNEGLNKLIYFFNGELLDQIDYPAGDFTNTGLPILIGESNCLPDVNTNFNGFIDDIGLWDRPLTSGEVNELFASCDLEILESPADVTVELGMDAMFTCASNYTESAFQWESDMGFGFTPLSDAGQYNGATNDTLLVAAVTMLNDNQKFRCIATSSSCSDTTEIALLEVNDETGIVEFDNLDGFNLYPNPAFSEFFIFCKACMVVSYDVYVYDRLGGLVGSYRSVTNDKKLSLSGIPNGLYFVRISSSEFDVTSALVIGNH